jgi:hypothetical protein
MLRLILIATYLRFDLMNFLLGRDSILFIAIAEKLIE